MAIVWNIAFVLLLAATIGFTIVAVANCFKQVCSKGAERDCPDGYRGQTLDD